MSQSRVSCYLQPSWPLSRQLRTSWSWAAQPVTTILAGSDFTAQKRSSFSKESLDQIHSNIPASMLKRCSVPTWASNSGTRPGMVTTYNWAQWLHSRRLRRRDGTSTFTRARCTPSLAAQMMTTPNSAATSSRASTRQGCCRQLAHSNPVISTRGWSLTTRWVGVIASPALARRHSPTASQKKPASNAPLSPISLSNRHG